MNVIIGMTANALEEDKRVMYISVKRRDDGETNPR